MMIQTGVLSGPTAVSRDVLSERQSSFMVKS